jgi:hemoglobin-like flavoprotein
MTPEQVQLVRLSFVKVMDIKAEAGRMFYERLFTIAPEVRPMFKSDIGAQADKLMEMLGVAISLLKNPTALSRTLVQLAQRHNGYGVRDEHYEKVGEALLWTLERGLGEAFTPELHDAWCELYTFVASAMKQAARPAAVRA